MKIREHVVLHGTQPMEVLKERGRELLKNRVTREHGGATWTQVAGAVADSNEYTREGVNYVTVALEAEV